MNEMSQLPKISVVMPCYNMEKYIEQTIKSILNQDYSNLELIIVDGASTDNSLSIIKKYSDKISVLISEKDKGQYDAINKGFSNATGDIFCWINADDVYFNWTFQTVALIFSKRNDINWLAGIPAFLNESGTIKKIYGKIPAKDRKGIINGWYRGDGYGFLQQESMFWRKELWMKVGGLKMEYSLAADYFLWTEFAKFSDLWSLHTPLAAFRIRNESRSKVQFEKYMLQVNEICKLLKPLPLLFRVLGSNKSINHLLRIMTFKKHLVIHQPFSSDEYISSKWISSLSGFSFGGLLREL